MRNNPQFWRSAVTMLLMLMGSYGLAEVRSEKLDMQAPPTGAVRQDELLVDEIRGVKTSHLALTGPISHVVALPEGCDSVLLFVAGKGTLQAGQHTYDIDPESIAVPYSDDDFQIVVERGECLHCVHISKQLSAQDKEDRKSFVARGTAALYFKQFSDCEAYTEAIKSPKTISRTVLPKEHVPRVAMGTVLTTGPDRVGAHEHPMLDQLFLGLAKNQCTVHADDDQIQFPPFSILHIPLGSSHGVIVEEGRRMHYLWMDFFLTKEGLDWLKTHKPVEPIAVE
ncbi:hypothetical protein [Botrimarina hoheduenensis]|uniref:Cupin domain protein n=1 Tax=Botrimarina hoheduenensis TaxID=2528000 RepID=A0A5C5VQH2_9BACT|nr:hypothetical protein [Botrimarina hoheduenensis]TWT40844.1 hypothetical protein Pla111_32620 [Botrimarina hoheduenensis]